MSGNSSNDWIYLEYKDIPEKDRGIFMSASIKPPVGHILRKYYTEQLAEAYEIYLKKKNTPQSAAKHAEQNDLDFHILPGWKTIISFSEDYSFLDNSYNSPIAYDGLVFDSAEAAFQAAKLKNEKQPENATKARSDWKLIRINVMRNILRAKFRQTPELAGMLRATGACDLVYGNSHNDTFWGYDLDRKCGQNMLGILLMEIREDLREGMSADEKYLNIGVKQIRFLTAVLANRQEMEKKRQKWQEFVDATGWGCYTNGKFAITEDEAAAQFDDAWAASLYTLEPPPENRWR